jgi:pSer/pThr/pTyr-binding forkhead associated (FHA) protein
VSSPQLRCDPTGLADLDMLPRFVSLDDIESFRLSNPLTLVGRYRSCEVQLDSSRVSRRHCCLAFGIGEVLVRDLGSTNGTWINGQRVEVGRLQHGDVLSIAHLRFRLVLKEQSEGLGSKESYRHKDVTSRP